MRKAKPDNPQLLDLIRFLEKATKENDAEIWATIADALAKPRSRRTSVNLSHINRYAEKNQVVAVAGKVLGAGMLRRPVTVAAFTFSASAKEKIKMVKGKCLTFPELVKKNPKGSNVKIVG
jgi:large subunit ribosomal protein L18e